MKVLASSSGSDGRKAQGGVESLAWARIRAADGSTATGILEGEVLYPTVGFGSSEPAGAPIRMEDVRLLAPDLPGKFIGLWNNYIAAAVRFGWSAPTHPLYFLKAATSVVGDGADVVLPQTARRVVFEGNWGRHRLTLPQCQ